MVLKHEESCRQPLEREATPLDVFLRDSSNFHMFRKCADEV